MRHSKTTNTRRFLAATLAGVFILASVGCGQSEPEDQNKAEGPAEKMGKQIDTTIQQTGEQAEAAMDRTHARMEEAGKKLDNAVERARADLNAAAARASQRLEAADEALRSESKDEQPRQ